MIDFYAYGPQMIDHMIPVWDALPNNMRGKFFIKPSIKKRKYTHVMFTPLDINTVKLFKKGKGPVLVANEAAMKRAHKYGRKTIIMLHDSGNTIGYPKPTMPGFLKRGPENGTILFLATGEHIANHWKERYPNIPCEIIGCPKLDKWTNYKKPKSRTPVVAFSFTWNWQDQQWKGSKVETIKGAYEHYRKEIPKLKKQPWKIIANAHQKMIPRIRKDYEKMGFNIVDFETVMRDADVYVCDYSSTIFEFAYTDRPVVVLNAPWNDKKINHGLRFWKCADVGVQVDSPKALIPAIEKALREDKKQQKLRRKRVDYIYPVQGNSAKTAAEAILNHVSKEEPKGRDDIVVQVKAEKNFLQHGNRWRKRGKTFPMTENEANLYKKKGLVTILPEKTKPVGPSETKPEGPEEIKETNGVTYKCNACGRVFDTPQGLSAHSRVHKG